MSEHEPSSSESGVSWRDYVDQRFAASDKDTRQQLMALERHIDLKFAHQDDSVDKANTAMTIRLERMNEFREQLTTERANYARKDQVESNLGSLAASTRSDLEAIRADLRALQNTDNRNRGRDLGIMSLGMTGLFTLITIVFRLIFP